MTITRRALLRMAGGAALLNVLPAAGRALLKARDASALFLMRRPGGLEEVDVNGFVAEGTS